MKAIMKAKNLKVLIEATKKFLAQSNSKPCSQYIRLEFDCDHDTVTAVGVDGYKLSVEHSIAEYIDESFVAYIKPSIPKHGKEDTAIIELTDKRCTIQIGDTITGYVQPVDNYLDSKNTLEETENTPVQYRIGFNPDLLIDALQSAKASNGGTSQRHVVLEFRSPLHPIIFKTGEHRENIKLICPVRIKEED